MSDLRIPSPCHEAWDAMTPAGHGRHCAACDKVVVDVADMSPSGSQAFLERELPARIARGERVCVRAHAHGDGRLRRSRAKRYLLTNGLAAIIALGAYGCADPLDLVHGTVTPQQQQQNVPVAGAVAPMPQPQPPQPQPLRGEPVAPQSAAVPAGAPDLTLLGGMRGSSQASPAPAPQPEPLSGDVASP